ncbi:MAG: hypothetical protein IPJ76_18345 [Flavobacteriales bacterium]|nr:MAG: hypothetical protein IPJ76_18345 [Flavobacteriales bacterium]
MEELKARNTEKLSKQEQFEWLDGQWNWERIQKIVGKKEIPLFVLDYFIEVTPDEYLEHLKKHNPPSSWTEDTYGEVQLKQSQAGYEIIYYSHGKQIGSETFDNYDQVLRYLVYGRLTNVSDKYKNQLKRSYYT